MNTVAWSPDSLLVASGSLDTSIIIWHVEKPAKHIIIKSKWFIKQIICISQSYFIGNNIILQMRMRKVRLRDWPGWTIKLWSLLARTATQNYGTLLHFNWNRKNNQQTLVIELFFKNNYWCFFLTNRLFFCVFKWGT